MLTFINNEITHFKYMHWWVGMILKIESELCKSELPKTTRKYPDNIWHRQFPFTKSGINKS